MLYYEKSGIEISLSDEDLKIGLYEALKKAVKYLDDEIKKFGKNFETSKSKK